MDQTTKTVVTTMNPKEHVSVKYSPRLFNCQKSKVK